jgi:toxin ParE1/3/4
LFVSIDAQETSPAIAERFTGAIVDHCEGFDTFPQRGAQRDDLRPGLRTVGFRRRVTIAFTIDPDAVIIIGVFYGGQDYEAALKLDE